MQKIHSRRHGPFAHAYEQIRRALSTGRHRPGERLKAVDIAVDLQLSPTPVREALATLAGEGLIERHSDGGYFALRLNAADLADLYAFQARCLGRSVPKATGNSRAALQAIGESVIDIRSATELLAKALGNATLLDVVRRVNNRLNAARRVEVDMWPDYGADRWRREAAAPVPEFQKFVARYLQQCVRMAGEIANHLADEI